MVKGISKQVIVVHSPDQKMFEQAIFILREGCPEISDDELLRQANRLMGNAASRQKGKSYIQRIVWALLGASLPVAVWALSMWF